MKLHISRENIKLGPIPSVSLPPGVSCPPGVPCREACYARKAYEVYAKATAKPAWDDNWALWNTSPILYWDGIDDFLKKKKPARFRWHVSGDIPSDEYFYGMLDIAEAHPQTVFTVYTKNRIVLAGWSFRKGNVPANLIVMESVWLDDKPKFPDHPAFIVVREPRDIPEGALRCLRNCRCCSLCYRQGIQQVFNVLH